jgi:hypothetical protein
MAFKIYYHQTEDNEFKPPYPQCSQLRFLSGFEFLVPFSEEHFEYVPTVAEADIVPMLLGNVIFDSDNGSTSEWIVKFMTEHMRAGQILLGMDHLMHVGEGHSDSLRICTEAEQLRKLAHSVPPESRPLIVWAHTNHLLKNSANLPYMVPDNLLYTDFLWNRQVTFYVTQPDCIFNADEHVSRNHWYPYITPDGLDKKIYQLSNLDIAFDPYRWEHEIFAGRNVPRLYLSANKARDISKLMQHHSGYLPTVDSGDCGYAVRDWLRSDLIEKLQSYPGFLGNPTSGNILVGQSPDERSLYDQIGNIGPISWMPMHNSYYDNSAISIYVETITLTGSPGTPGSDVHGVRSVTEKTWEPLIKGHLILPFAYSGFVDDLRKHYGVQFPDEIDYSYDNLSNDLDRWAVYITTVRELLNKGPDHLFKIKRDNLDKIIHNRDLFFNTGYRNSMGVELTRWQDSNQ